MPSGNLWIVRCCRAFDIRIQVTDLKLERNDQPLREQLSDLWRDVIEHAHREQLRSRDGFGVAKTISEAADTFIRWIYDDAIDVYGKKYAGGETPFTICAVGGYGRNHLQPHSDIDLLFLHDWKPTPLLESVTESILYTLWDLGFKVGHATRSIKDCVDMGRQDVTVQTNLLDIRPIVGDSDFFSQAYSQLEADLLRFRPSKFGRDKLDEMNARRERYGDTAYVLEPNIKESPGGLRDFQTVYWIAKAAFRAEELSTVLQLGILEQDDIRQLEDNFRFLFYLRNLLHFEAGKAEDRLTFDLQTRTAPNLGLRDLESELASEGLMRLYYERTRESVIAVDFACQEFMDRIEPVPRRSLFRRKRSLGDGFYAYRERLWGTATNLADHPHLLVKAFHLSQQNELGLSFELRKSIKKLAGALSGAEPDEFARASRSLLDILTGTNRTFKALSEMNELGVLNEMIPEFEKQYCRVQHDTYHMYTADVHLLMCVRMLARLRAGQFESDEPELTEMAQSISGEDLDILAAAVLLHDIGKGYGEDHSLKGAELSRQITDRLGMSPAASREVSLLIRHHLLLSHTAQRRDLSDATVIREFAGHFESADQVTRLMILTFCDQNGVGPGVWNPWKRSLMLQLHQDARLVLEREDIQGVHRNRIRGRRQAIHKRLENELPEDNLEQILGELPPRFFLFHDRETSAGIITAFHSAREGDGDVAIVPTGHEGHFVVLMEPDRPGLFSFHAGLFRNADMGIVSAEGYTLQDSGWVINLFRVAPRDPLFFSQPDRVNRFTKSIRAQMGNPDTVPDRSSRPARRRPRSRRRTGVRVHENLATNYTVFEVFGWDRLGLLQDLAKVFPDHDASIWLARIDTEGQRVYDVFYVEDRQGGQITDHGRIDQIRSSLLAVVSE